MINIDDFLLNILIQQLTLIAAFQGEKHVDMERIDSALIACANAVMLIQSMNDAGFASVDRDAINVLLSKYQLDTLIKSSGTIGDE